MKKTITILTATIMTISLSVLSACKPEASTQTPQAEASWIIDRFDDIKVLRYEVPGFENLPRML